MNFQVLWKHANRNLLYFSKDPSSGVFDFSVGRFVANTSTYVV